MGQQQQQRSSGFKSALVVAGGLAFAWLTIEMAFKPFLDRLRDSVAKSDPGRDPDGDGDQDASETPEPSSSSSNAAPSSDGGQAEKHEEDGQAGSIIDRERDPHN